MHGHVSHVTRRHRKATELSHQTAGKTRQIGAKQASQMWKVRIVSVAAGQQVASVDPCPTGLLPLTLADNWRHALLVIAGDRRVVSVCGRCGSGPQLALHFNTPNGRVDLGLFSGAASNQWLVVARTACATR